jgi:hypothetical protein
MINRVKIDNSLPLTNFLYPYSNKKKLTYLSQNQLKKAGLVACLLIKLN